MALQYTSAAIRWFHDVNAGNSDLNCSNSAQSQSVTGSFPLTAEAMWGHPGGSWESVLSSFLNDLHDYLFGSNAGSFNVSIDQSGHLNIMNERESPAADMRIRWNHVESTVDSAFYGYPGASTTLFPVGEWVRSPTQVGNQWLPGVPLVHDTNDVEVVPSTQTMTVSMRPCIVRMADPFYLRTLSWELIPAARVYLHRIIHASAAGIDGGTNDTNANLENLISHVRSEGGTPPGLVHYFSRPDSGANHVGAYLVLLEESAMVSGVPESLRNGDASLECFDLSLVLRKHDTWES